MDASERLSIAVIRAWIEPDEVATLKIRITTTGEGMGELTVGVTANIDDACSIIRKWLDAFRQGSPMGPRQARKEGYR